VECADTSKYSPQLPPTPASRTLASMAAVSVNERDNGILPGSRTQNPLPSVSSSSSVAGSPELSYIPSLAAGALKSIAQPATEQQSQHPKGPVRSLTDGQIELYQSNGLRIPPTDSEDLKLGTAAPRESDGLSITSLPPDRPRSPIMPWLAVRRRVLQAEPASDKAIAQPAESMEDRARTSSSFRPDEDMTMDYTPDVSRRSSYQLPSETRRSALSWPKTAMLETLKNVDQFTSALVPYQVSPERKYPSLTSPTHETMAIDSMSDVSRESSHHLPSEPRRSVLSWPTIKVCIHQD
jgi:hypothetical protein